MGKAPSVSAAGYTNSVAGTTETALCDIDAAEALVRQVGRHGGRVYVESDGVGQGSAFTVELPMVAAR